MAAPPDGRDAPGGDPAACEEPFRLVEEARLELALLDVRREAGAHAGLRHHVHDADVVSGARDLRHALEGAARLRGSVVGEQHARRR